MLNKPKFMKPSTNLTDCVIDIGENNDMLFSCIVDGNEAINAWRIQIYRLSDNVLVYDSSKQECSTFFPIDENNKNVVFSINLKDYWSSEYYKIDSDNKSLFKNADEPYYWTLSIWSVSNTDSVNSSATSCEEVFYANSQPSISLEFKEDENNEYAPLNPNQILTSKKCYFKAKYSHKENIPLKRYGWKITDIDTCKILLDTISHNQIYGTSDNIICFYDGFLNNGKYSVEVYIETQNNYVLISEPIQFSVSQEIRILSSNFKVEALKSEPSVMLNWDKCSVIKGKENIDNISKYINHYPIPNDSVKPSNSIYLPKYSYITFDYDSNANLDISENCYIALSMQLPNANDTTLFSAEGISKNGNNIKRTLYFNSGKFVYSILGDEGNITRTYTPQKSPNIYIWYVIILSPFLGDNGADTTLKVSENYAVGGLYPDGTLPLYPSSSLYPSFGNWQWNNLGEGE